MICEHLGIKGKTRVEPSVWEEFKYEALRGKQKSLKQIADHCKWDVITLERAFDKCFKYGISSISLA